jgi:hypothetical protein
MHFLLRVGASWAWASASIFLSKQTRFEAYPSKGMQLRHSNDFPFLCGLSLAMPLHPFCSLGMQTRQELYGMDHCNTRQMLS